MDTVAVDWSSTRKLMQSIEVKPLTAAMVVRPSVLVRVSGLPVNAVAGLRSADAAAQLEEIVALRDRMDATRDTLSARLFLAVGSATNSGTRGALLALRRALYRAEQPSVAALKARERLRPEDSDAVERALRDMADYNAAVAALRNVYQAALVASRRHFQLALADPDFQKSLLLSTRTLFDNLARYRAADPTRLRSRDEQIERGLLRYFTRAAMKATPFARFCSIAAGEFVPSSDGAHEAEGLQFDAAPGAKRGFVRLNKYLYGILWSHLKSRPVVRRILTIDLNPTLSEEAGKIVFLVAVPGGEAFCRMRSGETLDFVVAFVKDTAGRSHFELSTVLASHPSVQSTFEEAEQYLDALLACGLLRFRSLVPEQLADWDLPLSVALSTSEDIHAQRVARLLVGVRALADAYSAADVSERSMLAERVRIMLRDAFSELGIHARLPRDLPIYEDAATPAQLLIPRHLGVEESLVKMVDWIAMTAPLAHPRSDNATMRHFFDTQYAGESAVPLLRFYEDFYREHFRGHLDKERRIERGAGDADLLGYDVENPFGLDYIRAVRQARSRLFEIVRARWAMNTEAGVLHLDANAVRTAIGPLMAAHPSSVCCSASVFCQIVVPPGDADAGMLVMPQGKYFVGFGKYFSRFLYMLPPILQQQVYADNVVLAGDTQLAEICGDAQFNANLHPPLLPFEISYPTGEAGSHVDQLPSSEIDIVRDPNDSNALCLMNRSTRVRVLPVDLGFLNPRMRPPLYQLLMRFTPGASFGVSLPLAPHRVSAEREAGERRVPQIVRRPRIIFAERLVIARQRWMVPGELMPRTMAGEDDVSYMVRLDTWRRSNAIPEDVYVRILPIRSSRRSLAARDGEGAEAPNNAPKVPEDEGRIQAEPVEGAAEHLAVVDSVRPAPAGGVAGPSNTGGSRDWQKPQYINFASPLLVKLFERLPGALVAFDLVLEERYPDASGLPAFNGEAFSYEMIVQADAAMPPDVAQNLDAGRKKQGDTKSLGLEASIA